MTKNKKTKFGLWMAFLLIAAACAKKPAIKQSAEVTPVAEETPKQELSQDEEASIRGKDFTDIGNVATVYFELDSSEIGAASREAIAKNAEFLKANPKLEVRVDGHCDERGTTEFNMALGQRRAASVRAYYKSLGLPGDRLGTVSWGEEKPVCTESNDSCWDKNRRAETKVRLKEDKSKDAKKAKESKKTPEVKKAADKKATELKKEAPAETQEKKDGKGN